MHKKKRTSRRKFIKTGFVSLTASAFSPYPLLAAKKAPGEVRVVFLMGDYWHNPITQQKNWLTVLEPAGWRLMFAQASQFITPEVLSQADLFVVSRYAATNSLGWAPDRIIENWPEEVPFMTEERENIIVENVHRGMGLLAVHCAVWNEDSKQFMKLLGVEKPYMHTPVQPAYLHKLNQNHPITKDIEPCNIQEDEIFMADLIPGESEVLFNLKGDEVKTDRAGGWCREAGKGRVVTLLPGHNPHPYHLKSYKQIMWRSAHWAMKKIIPPAQFEDGRP
jgi:type 1 glutamine amidotransferase